MVIAPAKPVNAVTGADSPILTADGPASPAEPLRRLVLAALLEQRRLLGAKQRPSQANLERLSASCAA